MMTRTERYTVDTDHGRFAAFRIAPSAKCPHCGGPMDDAGLFEDMCSPCGREYATDDPSALGPDA
jgi:tRNA(Ile2) C34 agmatinyltransferase TiaS